MASDTILTCGRLHVRFFYRGDRYAHVISLIDAPGVEDSQLDVSQIGRDCITPLLESMEGGPDEEWPSSPPLQSLHTQQCGHDGRVALLVGMAGRSHWSAAVTLDDSPRGARVSFDMACRVHALPPLLGSRYRLAENVNCDPQHGKLISPAGVCRLEIDDTDRLQVMGSGDANWIDIRPGGLKESLPATLRWKYAIRVESR